MTQRRKILVPIKPTLNHPRALDAALLFAKELCADLHFICFLSKTADSFSKEEIITSLAQKINLCSENKIKATFELLNTENGEKIGEDIARIASKFDLVVIGHTQYDQIYRFLHRSATVDLINKVSGVPVIVVPDEKPQMKKD